MIRNGRSNRKERNPLLTTELKISLGERQNWRCCQCGCGVSIGGQMRAIQEETSFAKFQFIRPLSEGGKRIVDNLAISCGKCNETGAVWHSWKMTIRAVEVGIL